LDLARLTAAGTAIWATSGKPKPWRLFDHFRVLNREITEAIAEGNQWVAVVMPRQNGKTTYCSNWLPAWYLGTFPDKRVILASYEASYAETQGRKTRDIIDTYGEKLWGISIRRDIKAAGRWDLDGRQGGMIAAGVGGPVVGHGADLAILDDLIKNAEQAMSPNYRDKVWDWFEAVLMPAMHEGATLIIPMTRWHQDDIIGRIRKRHPGKLKVITMSAIAEEDEDWGCWKRKKGAPLCPDLFSLKFLDEVKGRISDYWWASMFQGRPYVRGGTLFKPGRLKWIDDAPMMLRAARGWDLAATTGDSAKYTAGMKVGFDEEGKWYILSGIFDKWDVEDRDAEIKLTAETDTQDLDIVLEQEPGSGGKTQVKNLVKMLAGWTVEVNKATTRKDLRAEAFATQVNIGNVYIVRDGADPDDENDKSWNKELVEEMRSFPHGTYNDLVDAAVHAFNYLSACGTPELSDTLPDRATGAGPLSDRGTRTPMFSQGRDRRFFGR
jgi:predicted phage terminase large subunit-like protein